MVTDDEITVERRPRQVCLICMRADQHGDGFIALLAGLRKQGHRPEIVVIGDDAEASVERAQRAELMAVCEGPGLATATTSQRIAFGRMMLAGPKVVGIDLRGSVDDSVAKLVALAHPDTVLEPPARLPTPRRLAVVSPPRTQPAMPVVDSVEFLASAVVTMEPPPPPPEVPFLASDVVSLEPSTVGVVPPAIDLPPLVSPMAPAVTNEVATIRTPRFSQADDVPLKRGASILQEYRNAIAGLGIVALVGVVAYPRIEAVQPTSSASSSGLSGTHDVRTFSIALKDDDLQRWAAQRELDAHLAAHAAADDDEAGIVIFNPTGRARGGSRRGPASTLDAAAQAEAQSERCVEIRRATTEARADENWPSVLRMLADRPCWPARDVRVMLRAEADAGMQDRLGTPREG